MSDRPNALGQFFANLPIGPVTAGGVANAYRGARNWANGENDPISPGSHQQLTMQAKMREQMANDPERFAHDAEDMLADPKLGAIYRDWMPPEYMRWRENALGDAKPR